MANSYKVDRKTILSRFACVKVEMSMAVKLAEI